MGKTDIIIIDEIVVARRIRYRCMHGVTWESEKGEPCEKCIKKIRP